jgi:hypothetical protein
MMRRSHRLLALLAVAAVVGACASSGQSAAPGQPAASTAAGSAPRNTNRALLTQDELRAATQQNMYDVVMALRPQWLRQGQVTSMTGGGQGAGQVTQAGVLVYLDGSAMGAAPMLRQITTSSVRQARYLTAPEAQARFGMAVSQPVIEILTATGR